MHKLLVTGASDFIGSNEMKRRHIAVFTHLGNGHVYPALGLCSELVQRGHRVTYATDEYYANRIRQTGAEPTVFKTARLDNVEGLGKVFQSVPPEDPKWWQLCATIIFPHFFVDATVALSQIESFYERNIPDLILYDRLDFAGRILSERLNSPAALMCFHFAFYRNFMIRENGVCLNPEPMLRFGKLLDSFLSAYGIDENDNLWHTENLNIYFTPKAFQYHGECFDESSCFVGSCLNRPLSPVWHNNSCGKPIILISVSSGWADSGFFKTIIDALSGREYHVILSIGENITESSLGILPANFEINRNASNLEIFPYAAITICHAGMGTVLESIYYGVPVIAVPPTPAHAEVAYRVAELRLGIHLPGQSLTVDMIRGAVESVLGDVSLLERVRYMQQVFRNSGGAEMASDKIEELLEIGRVS